MGGRWATAGIAFQAHIFLLRFFQGVAACRLEPAELAQLEGLSDILVPSEKLITLVQVKRTLDKKSLVGALEEAYLITKTCREHCPEALELLRFQIAYRRRATDLLPHEVDRLELFDGGASAQAFTEMQALLHEEPLVECPDHHDRLYLLLWSEGIRSPQSLIDKALGRILDAFLTPTNLSLARLARDLAEMFQEAARREDWKFSGQLLSSSDVSEIPDFIGHGILVGERVRFEHIRKGYVKQRPAVLATLVAQFRAWFESLVRPEAQVTDKIPVFWISGRSGDGKSVLLLQLVQVILREADDLPILHLSSGNAFLELLRSPPALNDQMAIAVVDDVYDLADRSLWEERARECVQIDVPRVALLTCGPTEQRDQFEAALADVFEVATYSAPHLSVQERSEFEGWFEQRTGRTGHVDGTEPNKLLVQVMFELEQDEELASFGIRFRRRLEQLDVYDVVLSIVAVNALYQDAPLELIVSERQRSALTRLAADDQLHFHIGVDSDGEPGVRLAHPHLAWLLFTGWCDPLYKLHVLWARELAEAMQVHLNWGRRSAASKIVQFLASTPRLGGESKEDVTRRLEAIANLYNFHVRKSENRPDSRIIHAWLLVLRQQSQLTLLPDPESAAKSMLEDANADALQRSRIAGALWSLAASRPERERAELIEKARGFFVENPRADGVPHMLSVLLAKSVDEDICRLVDNWLDSNAAIPDSITLLSAWLPRATDVARVVSQALGWLESNRTNPRAHLVIGPLLSRCQGNNDAVLASALEWVAANRESPNSYHVLASIVANCGNDEKAVEVALDWVRSEVDHPKVHQVISPLLSKATTDAGLVTIAMQWLLENPRHPSVGNVYCPLISEWPGNIQVVTFGKRWLRQHQSHEVFPEILGAVVTHSKHDPELISFAEASLQHVEAGRRVSVVVALLYGGRASPAHVKRALDFADTYPGLPRRKFLLKSVGTALAHHPRSMVDCLGADFTDEQKKSLCDSAALALTEYRALIEPFLDEVCRSLTGRPLGIVLRAAISNNLMPRILGSRVAEWLVDNYQGSAYTAVLRELKRHPDIYEYALRTRKLAPEIQQEYRNL